MVFCNITIICAHLFQMAGFLVAHKIMVKLVWILSMNNFLAVRPKYKKILR